MRINSGYNEGCVRFSTDITFDLVGDLVPHLTNTTVRRLTKELTYYDRRTH